MIKILHQLHSVIYPILHRALTWRRILSINCRSLLKQHKHRRHWFTALMHCMSDCLNVSSFTIPVSHLLVSGTLLIPLKRGFAVHRRSLAFFKYKELQGFVFYLVKPCRYLTECTFRCPCKPARVDRPALEAHALRAYPRMPTCRTQKRTLTGCRHALHHHFVELWTNWNTKEVFELINGFNSFLVLGHRCSDL